jgi:apolipoprotein N-acyltransferase
MPSRILFTCCSALILVLAFPRFDFESISWVALIPLFIALSNTNLRAAFGLCFLHALLFLMGVFYWINAIAAYQRIDFVLSGVYLATYFGLFGLCFMFICRHTTFPSHLSAPVLWVLMEYGRSHFLFLNLPWALLGHTQYLNVPLIQVASWTGVYGISFLIVFVNATGARLLMDGWAERRDVAGRMYWHLARGALPALALVSTVYVYGVAVLHLDHDGVSVPITVIQPNIPQVDKWNPLLQERNLAVHLNLTTEAAQQGHARLIVWPEASTQRLVQYDEPLRTVLSGLAQKTQSALLMGSSSHPKFFPREYTGTHSGNSAVLFSNQGVLEQQYNKVILVPFAEYLPYRDRFPWPLRFTRGPSHFVPGSDYTVFVLGDLRFSALICWETIFPDLVRQFARRDVHFLVNIGNEARFGDTAAPHQFLAMTVFRAAEHRIAIARSVNMGISAIIDPHGRIVGTIGNDENDTSIKGYLTAAIPVSTNRTFYTRFGDVFIYGCLALWVYLVCWAVGSAFKRRGIAGWTQEVSSA